MDAATYTREDHPNAWDGVAVVQEVARFAGKGCEAEIRLAEAPDGRWMWAIWRWWDMEGCGYAPAPKWGNFAETRTEAEAAAIDELMGRNPPKPVCGWLDAIRAAQADLFA